MGRRNKILMLFAPAVIAFSLSTEAYANPKSADVPYFPPNMAQSVTVSKSSEYIATPFADIIKWRYKSVNKKMYRRQYNYSKQDNTLGSLKHCAVV